MSTEPKSSGTINNATLLGFMDENLIIRNKSEIIDCKDINQLFKLKNEFLRRINFDYKRYNLNLFAHNTDLKLNSLNLSKLNFFHSNKITEKLDFLSEFKEMMFKDDFHFDENSNDKFISTNSSSLLSVIANTFISFWDMVGFYIKIIFYITIISIIVIVFIKLHIHKDLLKFTIFLFCKLKSFYFYLFKILRNFYVKNISKSSKKLEYSSSMPNPSIEMTELDIVSVPVKDFDRISVSP